MGMGSEPLRMAKATVSRPVQALTIVGSVYWIDGPLATRVPGVQRWDAILHLEALQETIASDYLSVNTIDPFVAETLRQAKQEGRQVRVGVHLGRYGYDLVSVEDRDAV